MDSIQLKLPFPPEIEWRDIPGYEGVYQVSDTGLVRRMKTGGNTYIGKILVSPVGSSGYPFLLLFVNASRKHWKVHQLVMLAFVGQRPAGKEINHKNGIKTDNRLENLEYITHQENITHTIQLKGCAVQGIKNHRAKLNDEKVREIRRLYSSGVMRIPKLSALYGVSTNVMWRVVNRVSWKHVE